MNALPHAPATSIAEVTYHEARRLAGLVVPDLPFERPYREISTYGDWLADFDSDFHVLEPAKRFSDYLKPEPVPACYTRSQAFARELLVETQAKGLVYPTVRRKGHRSLLCFRPALVYHPCRGMRVEISFWSSAGGYRQRVQCVPVPKTPVRPELSAPV